MSNAAATAKSVTPNSSPVLRRIVRPTEGHPSALQLPSRASMMTPPSSSRPMSHSPVSMSMRIDAITAPNRSRSPARGLSDSSNLNPVRSIPAPGRGGALAVRKDPVIEVVAAFAPTVGDGQQGVVHHDRSALVDRSKPHPWPNLSDRTGRPHPGSLSRGLGTSRTMTSASSAPGRSPRPPGTRRRADARPSVPGRGVGTRGRSRPRRAPRAPRRDRARRPEGDLATRPATAGRRPCPRRPVQRRGRSTGSGSDAGVHRSSRGVRSGATMAGSG